MFLEQFVGVEPTAAESQDPSLVIDNIIFKWPHTLSQTSMLCFQMEGGFNEKDTE